MTTLKNTSSVNNFESLATTIQQTNSFFLDKVQRQVNTALTLRNWIIGYYIVEYEQSGKDRAKYGLGLFKAIAKKLIKMEVKSLQNDLLVTSFLPFKNKTIEKKLSVYFQIFIYLFLIINYLNRRST